MMTSTHLAVLDMAVATGVMEGAPPYQLTCVRYSKPVLAFQSLQSPQLLALAALAAVAAAAAAALFLAVQGGKRRRRRNADDKNSFVADIFEGKKLKYCFKASRQGELSLVPHQGQSKAWSITPSQIIFSWACHKKHWCAEDHLLCNSSL